MDCAEKFLDYRGVVLGGRAREEVIGKPKRREVFDNYPVIAVGELPRGRALFVSFNQDRRAVFIRARNHEHIVSSHAHVTAECIGGNAKTSDMAKMTGTIGIRPSHRGQDVCHASILEGDWFAAASSCIHPCCNQLLNWKPGNLSSDVQRR